MSPGVARFGFVTAVISVLPAVGCADRNSLSTRDCVTPKAEAPAAAPQALAFVHHISGMGHRSTERSVVYFQSGMVLRFSDLRDIQLAWLGQSQVARLRDRLARIELATLPEASYVPPDSRHTRIGIWHEGRLKHYAWTERPFGTGASLDQERFARVWSAARSMLEELAPSSWADVSNLKQMRKVALDAVWARTSGDK